MEQEERGDNSLLQNLLPTPLDMRDWSHKSESAEILSRSPPAEDQPSYLPQKNVKVRIDLNAGSYSLSTSQLTDLEGLAWRTADTLNRASFLAEYTVIQVDLRGSPYFKCVMTWQLPTNSPGHQ